MTPQNQLVLNDPVNGVFGDCYRACIASLFDEQIESVPHFAQLSRFEGDEFYTLVNAWLADRGLTLLMFTAPATSQVWSDPTPFWPWCLRPVYHLLSGVSPRDPAFHHVVVAHNGIVCHDPHPDRSGIVADKDGNFIFQFFIPLAHTAPVATCIPVPVASSVIKELS